MLQDMLFYVVWKNDIKDILPVVSYSCSVVVLFVVCILVFYMSLFDLECFAGYSCCRTVYQDIVIFYCAGKPPGSQPTDWYGRRVCKVEDPRTESAGTDNQVMEKHVVKTFKHDRKLKLHLALLTLTFCRFGTLQDWDILQHVYETVCKGDL